MKTLSNFFKKVLNRGKIKPHSVKVYEGCTKSYGTEYHPSEVVCDCGHTFTLWFAQEWCPNCKKDHSYNIISSKFGERPKLTYECEWKFYHNNDNFYE